MSTRDKKREARARRLLTWGAAVLGVLLLPVTLPMEESWGLWVLFKLRGAVPPPEDLIVIGIDERSEAALGEPIQRAMHADLVDALASEGASVVVFDLFLHDESEDDDEFAAAIRKAGNVVLTARLHRESVPGMDVQTLRAPAEVLAAHAVGTGPWLIPEVFRVDWVFTRDGSDRPTVPLLALQAYVFEDFLAQLLVARPDKAGQLLQWKTEAPSRHPLERIMTELRRTFASDPSLAREMLVNGAAEQPALRVLVQAYDRSGSFDTNRLYLNYYGAPRTVTTVPYQDAVAHLSRGEALDVAGKAVFIGYSAQRQPGQEDDYPYVYSTNGFNLSGVELGATTFANLLYDMGLELPSLPIRAMIVGLWGLIIAACFSRLRVRPSLAMGVLLSGGYLWSAHLAFHTAGVWLPLVVPALQVLFAGALSVRVKQLTERAQLGIGTSEEAALALTGRGEQEKTDHRVILFADEQGSKKRLRRALQELDASQRRALQRDFAFARDVPIAENGGRINHTLADSMLAYWVTRDPADAAKVAEQAASACRAALAIQSRIDALNLEYPGFDLALRMGLDWGEISSQLNPSPEIKDWRMEGRPIHAAERLESLNKALGTSLLISHAVACRLDQTEFHCQELGTFVFRDDSGDIVLDAVRAYELTGIDAVTNEERRCAEKFDAALAALRALNWESALAGFESLVATDHRQAELSSRYVTWCRQTLQEAAPGWQGAIVVTFSDKSQYLDRFF